MKSKQKALALGEVKPEQMKDPAHYDSVRLGPFCYFTIEISCTNCDDPERAEGSNPSPSESIDYE